MTSYLQWLSFPGWPLIFESERGSPNSRCGYHDPALDGTSCHGGKGRETRSLEGKPWEPYALEGYGSFSKIVGCRFLVCRWHNFLKLLVCFARLFHFPEL